MYPWTLQTFQSTSFPPLLCTLAHWPEATCKEVAGTTSWREKGPEKLQTSRLAKVSTWLLDSALCGLWIFLECVVKNTWTYMHAYLNLLRPWKSFEMHLQGVCLWLHGAFCVKHIYRYYNCLDAKNSTSHCSVNGQLVVSRLVVKFILAANPANGTEYSIIWQYATATIEVPEWSTNHWPDALDNLHRPFICQLSKASGKSPAQSNLPWKWFCWWTESSEPIDAVNIWISVNLKQWF